MNLYNPTYLIHQHVKEIPISMFNKSYLINYKQSEYNKLCTMNTKKNIINNQDNSTDFERYIYNLIIKDNFKQRIEFVLTENRRSKLFYIPNPPDDEKYFNDYVKTLVKIDFEKLDNDQLAGISKVLDSITNLFLDKSMSEIFSADIGNLILFWLVRTKNFDKINEIIGENLINQETITILIYASSRLKLDKYGKTEFLNKIFNKFDSVEISDLQIKLMKLILLNEADSTIGYGYYDGNDDAKEIRLSNYLTNYKFIEFFKLLNKCKDNPVSELNFSLIEFEIVTKLLKNYKIGDIGLKMYNKIEMDDQFKWLANNLVQEKSINKINNLLNKDK